MSSSQPQNPGLGDPTDDLPPREAQAAGLVGGAPGDLSGISGGGTPSKDDQRRLRVKGALGGAGSDTTGTDLPSKSLP